MIYKWGLLCGLVVCTLTSQKEGLNYNHMWSISVCSLHVLSVLVWVFSGFLPPFKNMPGCMYPPSLWPQTGITWFGRLTSGLIINELFIWHSMCPWTLFCLFCFFSVSCAHKNGAEWQWNLTFDVGCEFQVFRQNVNERSKDRIKERPKEKDKKAQQKKKKTGDLERSGAKNETVAITDKQVPHAKKNHRDIKSKLIFTLIYLENFML